LGAVIIIDDQMPIFDVLFRAAKFAGRESYGQIMKPNKELEGIC